MIRIATIATKYPTMQFSEIHMGISREKYIFRIDSEIGNYNKSM